MLAVLALLVAMVLMVVVIVVVMVVVVVEALVAALNARAAVMINVVDFVVSIVFGGGSRRGVAREFGYLCGRGDPELVELIGVKLVDWLLLVELVELLCLQLIIIELIILVELRIFV